MTYYRKPVSYLSILGVITTLGISVLCRTDAKAETLELRALVSAQDAGKAWDLRCEVREKLVDFLQREYPKSLPKTRAELLSQKAE